MSQAIARDETDHPVVFFDGVCNLCNSTVDFIVRHDLKRKYRFAPLQGETAARMIPEHVQSGNFDSFVLVENGRKYARSTGAIRLLAGLGGAWSLLKALLFVPPFLRDAVYSLIARNRYRVFGKKDTCRLPSPDEKALFLP